MMIWHIVSAYVLAGIAYARIANRWTRIAVDDLLVPICFAWLLIPLAIYIYIWTRLNHERR